MNGVYPGPPRVALFVVFVLVPSALVVLLRVLTASWMTGAVVGALSGGLAAGAYPALFRGRTR